MKLLITQFRERVEQNYNVVIAFLKKILCRGVIKTKNYGRWLRPAFIISAPLIMIVGIIAYLPHEPSARYSGMILQLLGIATVIWEIDTKWQAFNLPGIGGQIRDWWRRRPCKRKEVTFAVSGISTSTGMATGASIRRPLPEGASLEVRVDTIERNFDHLDQDLKELQQMVNIQLRDVHAKIKAERSERQSSERSILSKLMQVHVGDLHISLRGVVWLIVGVILTSCSPEIAAVFESFNS